MNDSILHVFNKDFCIKSQWKIGFLATWIGGLLAHAYRFFNFLPSWDSMYNFTGTGATFSSGRCFLEFFSRISSKYDMPWVNGALSLLYISIAVVLLIELFEFSRTYSCILLALLVVAFPTVTASFAFMFTADGYMMAFLMSIAGIYLATHVKHGIWSGIICIGLSIGTYQAYISVSCCVILIMIIRDLLIKDRSFKEMFLRNWIVLPLLIGGLGFYKIASIILNAYYHVTLTEYQGINQIGLLSLWEYKQAFLSTYYELSHLFSFNEALNVYFYGYANRIVCLLLVLVTCFLILKKKLYKRIVSMLLILGCVIGLPIASFFMYFVSADVWYHTLMEMGACFIYILLLCYLEQGFSKTKLQNIAHAMGLFVLAYLSFYNIRNANIAYTQMNLSYEKSYSITSNLLDRIENLDEFPEVSKVAIIGTYHTYSSGIGGIVPYIIGAEQDNFLNLSYHYFSMWNYCFGVQLERAPDEEASALAQTAAYEEMDVYPAKNSVKVIDDTIVIKLSE